MNPPQTIVDYCTDNGWTDPQLQAGQWWAFPPNAVMPLPVPVAVPDAVPNLGFGLFNENVPAQFEAIFVVDRQSLSNLVLEEAKPIGVALHNAEAYQTVQILISGRYLTHDLEGNLVEKSIG